MVFLEQIWLSGSEVRWYAYKYRWYLSRDAILSAEDEEVSYPSIGLRDTKCVGLDIPDKAGSYIESIQSLSWTPLAPSLAPSFVVCLLRTLDIFLCSF